MVGASRVTKDVPPYMLVGREPAEVVSPNLVGLQRRGLSAEAVSALKHAFRLIWKSDLNHQQAIEKIREELPDLPEVRHLCEFIEQSQRGTL